MTSQKDQIQVLVDEIDAALQKAVSRLPWVASGQAQQRQLLQRIRHHLILQQKLIAHDRETHQNLNQSEASARQVMQSVVQDMNDLRSGLLRPLQSEVATLTQQRNALMREIRQLESRRQSYLMEPLANQAQPLTAQNLEHLQSVHDQADQVLGSLDTTLKVVFESLHYDIQAYQDSLSQGLNKLHNLGEQGEILFTTLINRLVKELGREASSHLQSQASPEFAGTEPPQTLQQNWFVDELTAGSKNISLPYPGTELPVNSYEPIASHSNELPQFTPEATPEVTDTPIYADSITTLAGLFEQLAADSSQPPNVVPVMPPAMNPKDNRESALSDLRSRQPSDALEPISSTLAEATYTPEENLLPVESPSQTTDLDLKLDSTTLNQLSEDLSNLEKKTVDASSPSAASASRINSIFSLEGLDDLFVEEPQTSSEPHE